MSILTPNAFSIRSAIIPDRFDLPFRKVDVVEPLLEQLASQTDPKLVALLRKPLPDVLADVSDNDRHVKGLALEALAFKIMRLLDMDFVATRLRGSQTGGAEVDLVFQSAKLMFSRWQIQCKNTARVALDDVAKEVGLTHALKSNAIVVVSTGKVSAEARRYANLIMRESNLAVVMIDGDDLKLICENPTRVVRVFRREAKHAVRLKELDA